MRKIVSAVITTPKGFTDLTSANVVATFDDGSTEKLFDFYHDEIRFTEAELIGLTEEEARQLKFRKDNAYLRS